jgi:hypothetical protein
LVAKRPFAEVVVYCQTAVIGAATQCLPMPSGNPAWFKLGVTESGMVQKRGQAQSCEAPDQPSVGPRPFRRPYLTPF